MTIPTIDFSGGLPPDHDFCILEQPEDTQLYGENHAFWFFDDAGQVHGYNHVDAFQQFYELRTERNWLLFPDGRVLHNWNEAAHTRRRQAGGGCLKFTCHEPFRRWSVDYLGTMRISNAEEMAGGPVREGVRAVVEYHIDLEMAAEPWKQGDDYAYGDTRYEQLYRHRGYLKTSQGDDLEISGTGVRTHRRGPRVMNDWFGHCWSSALFPSGRGFALKRFASEDGPTGTVHPKWSEACIVDRGRIIPAEVLESGWIKDLAPRGQRLVVRLRSALGVHEITGEVLGTAWRTMHIGGKEALNLRSFGVWGDPGEYILGQTACRWIWGDETVIGQHESSALTEYIDKSSLRF